MTIFYFSICNTLRFKLESSSQFLFYCFLAKRIINLETKLNINHMVTKLFRLQVEPLILINDHFLKRKTSMLNLKKSVIFVLSLGSSVVFAGAMGPVCNAVNSTVPCQATNWEFGAKALYLEPNVGSEDLFGIYWDPSANEQQYRNYNPTYSWGFQVEGSYHFNTGNDLNLNWSRVQKTTTRTMATGPDLNIGLEGVGHLTGPLTSTIDPSWNAVNLEFGQHVDYGDNKAIRFHGGLAYARVAADMSLSGTALPSPLTQRNLSAIIPNNALYNGFGPRIGTDMSYGLSNGLKFYSNLASALLVGKQQFSNRVVVVDRNPPTFIGSTTAVVPELEAKLGATYTYAMARSNLMLDAGWMWINYFDVSLRDKFVFGVRTSVGAETYNFSLQGPYIGLKWLGNMA